MKFSAAVNTYVEQHNGVKKILREHLLIFIHPLLETFLQFNFIKILFIGSKNQLTNDEKKETRLALIGQKFQFEMSELVVGSGGQDTYLDL